MELAFLWMLLTGALWGGVGVLIGLAPTGKRELSTFFLLYAAVFLAFVWLFRFPQMAPLREIWCVAAVIIPVGIIDIIGFYLIKLGMSAGNQGLAWSIVQSAMVIPFVGAVLFLGQKAGLIQWLGLVIMVVSITLMGLSKPKGAPQGKNGKRYLLLVFTAFLLIGIAQFMYTLLGNLGLSEAALSWRLPIASINICLCWLVDCLWNHSFAPQKVWKLSVIYGIVVALGQISLFSAIDNAQRAGIVYMVYPIVMSLCILLHSLYCGLVKREALGVCGWCGILLSVPGILLVSGLG